MNRKIVALIAVIAIVVVTVAALFATNALPISHNTSKGSSAGSSANSVSSCELGSNPHSGLSYLSNSSVWFQVLSDQPATLSNCNWAIVDVSGTSTAGTTGTPASHSFTNVHANATSWVNLEFSPCGSTNGSQFVETITVDNVRIFSSTSYCVHYG